MKHLKSSNATTQITTATLQTTLLKERRPTPSAAGERWFVAGRAAAELRGRGGCGIPHPVAPMGVEGTEARAAGEICCSCLGHGGNHSCTTPSASSATCTPGRGKRRPTPEASLSMDGAGSNARHPAAPLAGDCAAWPSSSSCGLVGSSSLRRRAEAMEMKLMSIGMK